MGAADETDAGRPRSLVEVRRAAQRANATTLAALIDDGRWDEAERMLRRVSLAGIPADDDDRMMATLTSADPASGRARWNEVRRHPALLVLLAVLRQQETGDVSAMNGPLRAAAAALESAHGGQPADRVSDLGIAALCALLAADHESASRVARRGIDLLVELGESAVVGNDERLAAAACDLAGVANYCDEHPSAVRGWRWVVDHVADPSAGTLAQAELGIACASTITGDLGQVTPRMRALIASDDDSDLGLGVAWSAFLCAARAWQRLDTLQPERAVEQTDRGLALFADRYSFGPLVLAHVRALVAADRADEAQQYLVAVAERGIPVADNGVTGLLRAGMGVMVSYVRGDPAGAAAAAAQVGSAEVAAFASALVALMDADAARAVRLLRESGFLDSPVPRLAHIAWLMLALAEHELGNARTAYAAMSRVTTPRGNDQPRSAELFFTSADMQVLATLAEGNGDVRLAAEFEEARTAARAGYRLPELTEREREVLVLLSEGRTNAEIAAALFVSVNTVKFHAGRLYRQLGVSGRDEAVAAALRARIVLSARPRTR